MNETLEVPHPTSGTELILTYPRPESFYLVWNTSDNDPALHYWEIFETIDDAVSTHGDGVEVFRAVPKRLGKYKRKVLCTRIKARKKRKVVA